MNGIDEKEAIRRHIWSLMMERGVARFPLPVYNRIPNFIGAEDAARRLIGINEYISAETIKVNPDSPQKPVREYVLRDGKTLIMPTPRIKKGFILIKPEWVKGRESYAATIKGAFKYGRLIGLDEIPFIDFIVEGSVAVSYDCGRLGKGEGYAELEYAILREVDRVDDDVKIATTIHPIQLVASLPQDMFDVPVDIICMPNRVLRPKCRRSRPRGIYWEYIDDEKMQSIPILRELRDRSIRK